jgi:methionyl-tRNA synthetase
MRTVAEVNKYVSDQAPWKLAKGEGADDRERLATVLHVTAQAVADCNLILSPFLPHAANAVDRVLGGDGTVAPMPVVEEVRDLDADPDDDGPGSSYPILTGEYSDVPPWRRAPIAVGTPIGKPSPVFTKLDPSVVDDELARLAG